MPTQAKLNRSQAIRDYIAANPNAKPKEIRAAMKAKGITVSTSLVGAVLYRKGGRKARTARPAAAKANGLFTADQLLEAKRFVEKVGGVEAARRVIEVLGRLA